MLPPFVRVLRKLNLEQPARMTIKEEERKRNPMWNTALMTRFFACWFETICLINQAHRSSWNPRALSCCSKNPKNKLSWCRPWLSGTMQSLNLQRKCARTDLLRFHIQKAQKRVYTLRLALMTLADLLKEDFTTSAAINSLVTKETSELEHAIRCFKPRYNKPLPDRTWKWKFYLGNLASEEVRDVVRALCNYKGCRDKISFEPMRAMQQPESEKKLWTWIKKQPRGS